MPRLKINSFKTQIIFLLCLVCSFFALSCSKNEKTAAKDDGKITVITTIFPAYDWCKNIASDNVNLELLITDGSDLHNFQPTVKDIVRISECDVFVYVGGQSDLWVADVLKNAKNKNLRVINLMESLGDSLKVEELVEGMEAHEHDHDHDSEQQGQTSLHAENHEHEHEHEHDSEQGGQTSLHDSAKLTELKSTGTTSSDKDVASNNTEEHKLVLGYSLNDSAKLTNIQSTGGTLNIDEHIWLSLHNAKVLCGTIANVLCSVDSDNAQKYKQNLNDYLVKIDALNDEYKSTVENAKLNTVLFADRFPFRYLIDDYRINYFAAFAGCSAETEASFKTIQFLSSKLDEFNLPCVLVLENSDKKLAKTIIENSSLKNQTILQMNSMQSVGIDKINAGLSYLEIMKENLQVLQKALN